MADLSPDTKWYRHNPYFPRLLSLVCNFIQQSVGVSFKTIYNYMHDTLPYCSALVKALPNWCAPATSSKSQSCHIPQLVSLRTVRIQHLHRRCWIGTQRLCAQISLHPVWSPYPHWRIFLAATHSIWSALPTVALCQSQRLSSSVQGSASCTPEAFAQLQHHVIVRSHHVSCWIPIAPAPWLTLERQTKPHPTTWCLTLH